MDFYKELQASLDEAVAIHRGQKKPSKVMTYTRADVRAIRERLNLTRQEMAQALDASAETIKSWEQHRRNPTGLTLKVLRAIEKNPALFYELAKA